MGLTARRHGNVNFAIIGSSYVDPATLGGAPKVRTRRGGAPTRRGLFGNIKSAFDHATSAVGHVADEATSAVVNVATQAASAVVGGATQAAGAVAGAAGSAANTASGIASGKCDA
jgi:hypothetical protein